MKGVTNGNIFIQPLLKLNMHSREEEFQQRRMTDMTQYLGYAVSLPLKMKFCLYFFHAHTQQHCREPRRENSAEFSLKASCVPNAKSLSWPYRSLRLSFPQLCNKSSGVVLPRCLLCAKGYTSGQAVMVTGQLAQTKKRPVSGVHLLLASILFLERDRQEWEGFSPVFFLPLPPNKNRLQYPSPLPNLIENIKPKENKTAISRNKLHHVPKSYRSMLLHHLFSFEQ